MSKGSESFMQKCLRGQAMSNEVDDFVERWHLSRKDIDIEAFLGMTRVEYEIWLRDPNALDHIIASRRERAVIKRSG